MPRPQSSRLRSIVRVISFVVAAAAAVSAAGGLRGAAARAPAATLQQPAAVDPCAAPANRIVAENCRPGTPRERWDVNGSGDPEIQGFAAEMSVNPGETIQFKIRTHSARYRIDIFRMGWYGGAGARLVDTIRPSAPLPQPQPDCRVHAGTRLVDCGNWRVSASWRVPADGVSGIYAARLVREDDDPLPWRSEGTRQPPSRRPDPLPHRYGALGLGRLRDAMPEPRASHIVFVVRDDGSRSDILLQTADPTWVAFNRYGGASLYGSFPTLGGQTGGGGNASIRTRAFKVSYNRPLDRDNSLADQFFNSEYPLVRWLERNGYDVTYVSGLDTDRRGDLIRQHRVFVSAGHDAYWSDAQRRHVEAARDAGVHLAFMGGGVAFWRTRYEASIDGSDTPYRTLVSYKESLSDGKLDPVKEEWTGAWRDGREFNPEGGRPENALTGTIATVGGSRNDRVGVPARYGRLPFWRNTEVAALADGETATLGHGILGPGWDEDLDNGARPAGLVRLSETTIDGVPYLQDWGLTWDSGTATHAMTLYRAASGALVFSAGTPQFAWGLDEHHTYWTGTARVRPHPEGPVPALQQATVNLLADMGVQPHRLQPELRRAERAADPLAPMPAPAATARAGVAPGDQRASAPPRPASDPCAAPANAIVAENCRPGNPSTEWDVNGAGDPSIQGFSTDISYNVGETAQFKVRTDSSRYRIDIYRTGYYGGLGARLVATLKPSAPLPQAQPECVADWSVRLYDCGNWGVSASWPIPAGAVSGVYIARLVREDGAATWRADGSLEPGPRPPAAPHAYGALGLGRLRNPIREPRASHIVFLVRDDASRAPIVVHTSDTTWVAYNLYGLGSTYNGLTAAGEQAGRNQRAYKVSYNRPLLNRGQSRVNQYFNAEYPLVRWLERNGYDVTYLAGVDTERRGERIRNHRLFISVGHDEYWSAEQRRHVEAARDAGVNLAFMSGNEVFWKTRMEPSIDGTATPHRTLVVYKETHTVDTDTGEIQPPRKIDPTNIWTGTWRDAVAVNPEGAQPENALTGTIFTVNANRQDPLIVPAGYGKLRFWRNTEAARLQAGRQLVVGIAMLGHEWDEDLDNGFRPAGLIRLSETTIDGVPYPVDAGSVYDTGTATHTLTLYRAPSGALVFGGGCVQYTWGLDNVHDNPTARGVAANPYSFRVAPDPYGPSRTIQQATVNLFADMGIQPANLQGDLVPATASTDRRAPLSRITSPTGAVAPGTTVTITGTATDAEGVVAGVEISLDGGRRWHPAVGTDRWRYEWQVPAGTGTAVLMTRASDDSVNVEVPKTRVTITYGRPTGGGPPASR
jgi:hypothetical protein